MIIEQNFKIHVDVMHATQALPCDTNLLQEFNVCKWLDTNSVWVLIFAIFQEVV